MEAGKVEMAQKVTVTLEDDLTGGPAKQTVRFAFDGTDGRSPSGPRLRPGP